MFFSPLTFSPAATTDDKWQKLAFDEGAPSMPLDVDQNETTMIGFELDLKNTTPYDVTTTTGETVSVPPPPIVWAYASDGTVTAWYVVNTQGTPYPSMGQTTTLSPVTAPAAPVPTTSPFSQAAQPVFGQTSPSAFGQPSQPNPTFGSAGSTFGPPAFGQASMSGAVFGQRPTFGSPGFAQTSAGSAFGQPSSSGQAPSGEGFASFASAPVKWGQTNFGSTASSFTPTAPPASPPQIQPSESTESMSTDSGQDLSFSGMSLGESTIDARPKAGSGMTSMFGSPAPATQPAAPATTSAFGGGSFISPGIGAFSKFVPRQTGDSPNAPTVEVPKPSPAFGQTGFGAPAFGQSAFGQSAGLSAFGKTGLGTPMSTTPIVTPVSATSPSTFGGSGGAFSAFASGGPTTLSGSKPAETKLTTPTMSGSGAFGAFASSGPSAFGQAASTTAESVPAWKTGGDAKFGNGTGSNVFGGTSSIPPLGSTTTPAKSLFVSAEPAPSTTPAFSPPTTTSLEKAAPSSAGTTLLTPPFDGGTPLRGSQSPPGGSTAPTSPLTAADLAKPTLPPASTTPAGPPVPNAFMGLKMSTGFGLSNFNAKDSPFANPKPVSQTVSAFGEGQPSAPKMPVPATPGSVFGQTSTIGIAAKPVSAFGQPAFGSPSTPTAAASTTPSSSQTGSSNAFSAFSGIASAFGKSAGSAVSFSDMLRNAGSSPDSKSKEAQTKGSLETGLTPQTLKSAFDKSPTPRPTSIPAGPDSEDEGEGEKDKDKDGAHQVVSADSSFSNLSSSSSSFVDVPRGGEEEEEEDAVALDGGDGEQQIDEFLSGTDSEGEAHEEEPEEEGDEDEDDEEEQGEVQEEELEQEALESDDEENNLPTPAEADPTAVPLPKSRSPSSTPKAENPLINLQPTFFSKPEPDPGPSSSTRSTTPPGSPSTEQTPLQQPTPTLPSPSQTPSPSPISTSSSLGRASTRPPRSSPLANAPVSGGDEEEVKGDKLASLKPRPASPKTPFGQWDSSAKVPSPTPPTIKLESDVDQAAAKAAPPSMIPSPKTPPLLTAKGTPLSNKTAPFVTGATPPAPTSGWIGFSLSGTGPKSDTKLTVEDAAKPATTTTPGVFAGIRSGAFSHMPKPEAGTEAPAAINSKVVPAPLFGTKPSAFPGTTIPKLPLAPAAGPSLGNIPGAMTPATSMNSMMTPPRTLGVASFITPPKETPSAEPMLPMQMEFAALYTEVGTELAAVRLFPSIDLCSCFSSLMFASLCFPHP